MDRNKTLMMTKNFIMKLYNLGSVHDIIAHMEDSITGFGTQSRFYSVGTDAVSTLLYKELALVSPCKVVKIRLKEEHISRESSTVFATVVLRTAREGNALAMHRILFMYHLPPGGAGYRLTGIHITKDIRHASTYRLISTSMLNRQLENQTDELQATRVVPAYASSAYVIYRMDAGHPFLSSSDELWQMLGYTEEGDIRPEHPQGMLQLIYEKDRCVIQNELRLQLLCKASYQLEYRMQRQDGSLLWVIECGRCVPTTSGELHCHSIVLDITPLRETSESFVYHESYDELTRLYNKRAFYQKAQELISLYPEKTFEIMRMDIERFKIINDLYDEEAGDELLKYIARFFLNANLPQTVFGRLHSDHFLLCYPSEGNNRQRFITSLSALAASYVLDYNIIPRFGVYKVTDRGLSVSTMCDRAGMALNKAKRSGLLVCGEYDEHMRQSIVNEQAIINDMAGALAQREFIIYIQPKYETASERIVGGEALVRWMHPVRGCISPAEFIPVFEHNGFIFQLDQFVWEETCRLLRKWQDEGNEPFPISVNVSRVDLYNANLVDILYSLVQRYDIPARLLELEVTESAYMDNPQRLIEVTKRLQSMGFVILMDDFGSGYSSLNMLKDMPVDLLKLDLKFLDSNRDHAGRGGNILNSIVRMAKWLKLPVIAEGVETQQQAEFLRFIGCDYAQGYYYSHPVSVEEYEHLLAEGSCKTK